MRRFLGLGAVAVIAAGALVYFLRLELATRWLLRELAARGVQDAELRVTRLGARGVALSDVDLGPVFGAREAAVELESGRLRRVRLVEPRLRLDLRPGAPLLGELDAPLRLLLAGTAVGSSRGALPALEISGAQLRWIEPGTEASLEGSLDLDESARGRLRLAARDWRGIGSAALELALRLAVSAHAVSIAWDEPARAELDGLPWGVEGPVRLSSKRGRVDVNFTDELEVAPDLELVAEAPVLERVRAVARVELDPGIARVDLGPIEFSPGGPQPADLDPRLAVLSDVSGQIAATAELRWAEGELRSSTGELTLRSLRFRGAGAALEGLGGVVRLRSLLPLASPPGQMLEASALQVAGIRFDRPQLRFALTPEGLRVEEARLALGTGAIRIHDVGPRGEATVSVQELELEELLALADLEGVTGSGKISGAVPVRLDSDALEIPKGVLESTGPGRLRATSPRVRGALGSAGETLEQLVSALEDFHYDTLRLELEKPAHAESSARLHLLGRNPAVLEGRDFALNVNLSTDLEPLLRALGAGLKLTGEAMLSRGRQREERE
jgi:hypothetical protein